MSGEEKCGVRKVARNHEGCMCSDCGEASACDALEGKGVLCQTRHGRGTARAACPAGRLLLHWLADTRSACMLGLCAVVTDCAGAAMAPFPLLPPSVADPCRPPHGASASWPCVRPCLHLLRVPSLRLARHRPHDRRKVDRCAPAPRERQRVSKRPDALRVGGRGGARGGGLAGIGGGEGGGCARGAGKVNTEVMRPGIGTVWCFGGRHPCKRVMAPLGGEQPGLYQMHEHHACLR